MTSSLVGSEMCIRDSHAPLRTTTHQPFWRACCVVRIVDAAQYGIDRAPVSYTHLTLPTICSV
eukprot:12393191-Prorocentrum_lima.AAC.1